MKYVMFIALLLISQLAQAGKPSIDAKAAELQKQFLNAHPISVTELPVGKWINCDNTLVTGFLTHNSIYGSMFHVYGPNEIYVSGVQTKGTILNSQDLMIKFTHLDNSSGFEYAVITIRKDSNGYLRYEIAEKAMPIMFLQGLYSDKSVTDSNLYLDSYGVCTRY